MTKANNVLRPVDPSRTQTLRNQYARQLRGELYKLGSEIEAWFNNPLNIAAINAEDFMDDNGNDIVFNESVDYQLTFNDKNWSFQPKGAILTAFKKWLSKLINSKDENDKVTMTSDRFIEKAYHGGASQAEKKILPGVAKTPVFALSLRAGTFFERLAIIKTVSKDQIKSLKGKLADAVVNRLAQGLIAGESPREVGRAINKQWRQISKTSATRIARTEVIRAHNEGALDRMESLGVKKIGVEVEWSVTKHLDGTIEKRVCPKCRPLDGLVLPIERAHGMLPRHPNCRCSVIPVLDTKPVKTDIRAAVRASVKVGKSKQALEQQSTYQEKQGWPGKAMGDYLK